MILAMLTLAETYDWTPTNSAEITAFVTHVRGLTDGNATLTLTHGGRQRRRPRLCRQHWRRPILGPEHRHHARYGPRGHGRPGVDICGR